MKTTLALCLLGLCNLLCAQENFILLPAPTPLELGNRTLLYDNLIPNPNQLPPMPEATPTPVRPPRKPPVTVAPMTIERAVFTSASLALPSNCELTWTWHGNPIEPVVFKINRTEPGGIRTFFLLKLTQLTIDHAKDGSPQYRWVDSGISKGVTYIYTVQACVGIHPGPTSEQLTVLIP